MAETARVRAFIAKALKDDMALQALTPTIGDRIFTGVAPRGSQMPYATMQMLSPGNDLLALGAIRLWANMLWLVKVTTEGTKTGAIEPIVDRIDAILHAASGTVTGGVIWECVRERPFELPTFEDGKLYIQIGGEYRIKASRAT